MTHYQQNKWQLEADYEDAFSYKAKPAISLPVLEKTYQVGNLPLIRLLTGNIADMPTDAIVNAANPWLRNGSGVTGSIFSAASDEFVRTSTKIGYVPLGRAVLVGNSLPSKLRCKGVIHGVAPEWQSDRQDHCKVLTREMYEACYEVAEHAGFQSLAYPAMGTGVYNVPLVLAAEMAIDSLIQYADTYGFKSLSEIRFVLFSATDFHVYKSVFIDTLV